MAQSGEPEQTDHTMDLVKRGYIQGTYTTHEEKRAYTLRLYANYEEEREEEVAPVVWYNSGRLAGIAGDQCSVRVGPSWRPWLCLPEPFDPYHDYKEKPCEPLLRPAEGRDPVPDKRTVTELKRAALTCEC